jgi:bla regulator protein blaR1
MGLDCGPRGESTVRTGAFVTSRPGHVQGHAMNMASLVNLLGALLRSPVVDRTGFKGNYDFDLEFTPDDAPPAPPVGGEGSVPTAGAPPDANGVSLFAAVQSQLGLKLETKKGPMELIVVDHVERAPTEN